MFLVYLLRQGPQGTVNTDISRESTKCGGLCSSLTEQILKTSIPQYMTTRVAREWHWTCISYLLLCHKLPQTLVEWNKINLLSHSFRGPGIWEQLHWVILTEGVSGGWSPDAGQGCGPGKTWRGWKICFWDASPLAIGRRPQCLLTWAPSHNRVHGIHPGNLEERGKSGCVLWPSFEGGVST